MKDWHYQLKAQDTLKWGEFSHFSATGLVSHGFSTRWGGISTAPYQTLNLGLHTGDNIEAVCENRRRFCGVFNLDLNRTVMAEQVHGEAIAVVTEEECGYGALVYETAISQTDALITNIPGVPIMLFYADCVPVYFLDPENRVIGVAHAGWKGTVAHIGAKTVAMMGRIFGTKPDKCLAAIGPSIGPCCYEVDQFVYDQVIAAFPDGRQLLRPIRTGKWQFDLWAANQLQLEEIGILTQNIKIAKVCTSCNADMYYSYRAEHGKTGRMGALLALKKSEE